MVAGQLPPQIKSYSDDTFKQRLTWPPVANFKVTQELARKFCKQLFDNLDEFPFVYFTAGITEALDYLLPQQPVVANAQDYRYVFAHRNVMTDAHCQTAYQSYPFAGDGRFYPFHLNERVILDCAYLCASDLSHEKRLPGNVSQVLFSASKGHNLATIRSGWVFSRTRFDHWHVLQHQYDYGGSIHASVLSQMLQYEPNHLYLKYKEGLSQLYRGRGLQEHNVNLFAMDVNYRRVPWVSLGLPSEWAEPA